MVAYSLENTAGKTQYKRGLNVIVTLKKSAEISRAVISSSLFYSIFFPHVFQSYSPVFINLIYDMLQHGIKQHYFVMRYHFENEPPFCASKNYMFNYYHKINSR